jgi:hypothetical protein
VAQPPPAPALAPRDGFGARFQAEAQRLGGDLPNRPAKVGTPQAQKCMGATVQGPVWQQLHRQSHLAKTS